MIFFIYIKILIVNLTFRYIYLNITSTSKIKSFSLWKTNNELLNKSGNVVVRYNLTFPFLNTKYFLWYFYFHILSYFNLTSKTIVLHLFSAREMRFFCWENISTTFNNLAFTHTTSTTTSACRRKEYLFIR